MKTELKSLSGVRREVAVEVPASDAEPEMRAIVRGIAKRVRLPGFRAGKVPEAVVRRQFRREIEGQLFERLLPKLAQQALEDLSLRPLAPPAYRDVAFKDGEPLRFVADFEVAPTFDVDGYKGIVVSAEDVSVTEADIERELERIREQGASFLSVEGRPLELGDYALADVGSTPVGGEREVQEKVIVEVSEDLQRGDGVGPHVRGMQPGERRSFRLDHPAAEPGGEARSIDYDFTLHEVKKKQLPALDDEFARDVGSFATLAVLSDHIRAELMRRREDRRRHEIERQLEQALTPRLTFEPPAVLVEQELDRQLHEQATALKAGGVDLETAPIDWTQMRESGRERAAASVRWALFIEAVADKESIVAEPSDVDARIARIAERSGRAADYVRSNLTKDGRMNALEADVRRGKAVDFLIRNARIETRSS